MSHAHSMQAIADGMILDEENDASSCSYTPYLATRCTTHTPPQDFHLFSLRPKHKYIQRSPTKPSIP